MISVGICGAGHIVPNHAQAMARTDGVELVAISSRTPASARKMARQCKVRRVYDDHRQLIEAPEVDVVVVATPNYQHCELALRAIDAGKHVMVEKPLAITVAEGRKMIAAAKRAGVHLIYAEQLPLAPKFARLIALARAGEFGDLYMVRQIERHQGPYSPWFFQKKTAGGGALMDLGCHSIAVAREIVNKQPVKRVSALARTFRHKQGNVDDFMIVQLEFGGGCLGVIESNWCHLGGMDSITEVFGSRGNGYADLFKGSGLELYSERPAASLHARLGGWTKPQVDPCYENGYVTQIEAMRDTVLYDVPPAQSGEDGLAILEIMAAAYRAAKGWGVKVGG